MTAGRITVIVLIFLLGAVGWLVLGSASWSRSHDRTSALNHAVRALWGSAIVQQAPAINLRVPGSRRTVALVPVANRIQVELALEHRRKGLIWYPTYVVAFKGRYAISNDTGIRQSARLRFPFPAAEATYEALVFLLDDRAVDVDVNTREGIRYIIPLAPGETRTFEIRYRTRGLSSWRYRLAGGGRTKGLRLTVNTNCNEVDFPEESLSPMEVEQLDGGQRLLWESADLVTHQDIGITMPERINPGPLAARMSFFAPVCLLFFFVLISTICILRGIDIHPMHYLFVNAGFFAFHLVFAYLVDLIDVHLAFGAAAVTSVTLVVSYLAAALGRRFPWRAAALGQIFYLVVFYYSFFLQGMTGITVTIASVITLAVLMRMTVYLNWDRVFKRQAAKGA